MAQSRFGQICFGKLTATLAPRQRCRWPGRNQAAEARGSLSGDVEVCLNFWLRAVYARSIATRQR